MMRQLKILAVAASLLGLVSTASAEMEVTGKARVRAEQNTVGLTAEKNFIGMSTDLGMKFTPDPKVMFFIQPQFMKIFGDSSNGSQPAGAPGTQSNSGTVAGNSGMDVHQAYTTYTHSEKIAYTFGRYEMKYGDELVIGPVGWSLVERAFDGLKAHWTVNDMVWADVFYNKLVETTTMSPAAAGSALAGADNDSNLVGIYIGGKNLGPIAEADIYYLIDQNNTPSGTGTDPRLNRSSTGVRLKGAQNQVDYRVEYTTQSGKDYTGFLTADANNSISNASQTNVEVGYKFGEARVSAEYFTSDKNYNQLYPTAHKWLGYGDWFGRRNINGFHVGASYGWAEHMKVALDYHSFSRTDANTQAYKLNGSTAYTLVAGETATTATDIGSEIDLTVVCTHQKALTWTAGYSYFTSGNYGKAYITGTPEADASFGYVMATTTF